MDDNPYPNDGSYFNPGQPEQNIRANEEELNRAAEAGPFIDEIIKWFDQIIESTDSIRAAREDAKKRGKSIEATAEAYDIARELFEARRGELQSLKLVRKSEV